MTRRLPALLLILALAAPAAAEARTKSVKLRMAADGDVSFARYVVTTSKPDELRVRNARRLGSSMILTAVRPLSRRRFEVTAMLANPGGGAVAAQGNPFDVVFRSGPGAGIAVRPAGAASNVLTQPVTPKETESINRFCDRPPPRQRRRRGRGFYQSKGGSPISRRRIRVLFTSQVCQDAPASTTAPASRQLRELGIAVPGCSGTVERYGDSPNEVTAKMVCTQATNVFSLRARTGNEGLNCLGPPGSSCACGPFCAPLPRESACYVDSNGFESDTLLEFRASFFQPVDPEDISGIWVPQGSPVMDARHAYLRHLFGLDGP